MRILNYIQQLFQIIQYDYSIIFDFFRLVRVGNGGKETLGK